LDSAFWFYYPENLSALEEAGAELVRVNALDDPRLPDLDGLYIGGGFPETQAERLAGNRGFREDLRARIEAGLPVYAECGGLMYLGEHLVMEGGAYPMVGALPVDFVLERKPQGHGYTRIEVTGDNPFYERGACIKGHEFHYSRPVFRSREGVRSVFRVERGRGLGGEEDGLCRNNLLATYTHVHALGTPSWAGSLVRTAAGYRDTHGSKISTDFQKRD
jgi:cobyrinic acid a,c-diamide synthase